MAFRYHPNARTTVKIRKEINESNLPAEKLAEKYNIHINTVYKYKHRDKDDLADHSHATKVKSYTLTELQRYIICEVKKFTLLSLDDLLEILKPFIPKLTRKILYTTLKQEGLNNNKLILPSDEIKKKRIKKFKNYDPGYIHIDIKYLPKIDKKRKYLFVAIDRKTRIVFIKIYDNKSKENASDFLDRVEKFFPFKIHKILTDNGKEFTDRFRRNGNGKPTGLHLFDKKCKKENIEHRLIKAYMPQTNGMVERMNGRIQKEVLSKYHFKNYEEIEKALNNYIYTYNFFIKQKKLDNLSPINYIDKNFKNYKEWIKKIKYNQGEHDK